MTVNVSKPAFNIREILSELEFGHLPYEKMPSGSILQASTFTIDTAVTFSNNNFTTGYTHQFKPKSNNSKIIHHFWAKSYVDNVANNAAHDYRLLGGDVDIDIGSYETITRASWQNYLNRVQYARDQYFPCDFIAVHEPHTTRPLNYYFQGRRYAGLSTNNEWKIGDTNMSGLDSLQRGSWIIYEVAQ